MKTKSFGEILHEETRKRETYLTSPAEYLDRQEQIAKEIIREFIRRADKLALSIHEETGGKYWSCLGLAVDKLNEQLDKGNDN